MIRIDHEYRPTLTLDLGQAKPLTLDAYETPTLAQLAPIIEGKPDVTRLSEISLRELGERFRLQKIVFSTASDIYEQMKATWKGSREYLLAQVIRLVEKYIESDKLRIEPLLFNRDPLRRRIIITLHMSSVAEHLRLLCAGATAARATSGCRSAQEGTVRSKSCTSVRRPAKNLRALPIAPR